MKICRALVTSLFVTVCLPGQEPEAPNPPELQALAAQFVQAFKSADDAAMTACWHSPEIFAKQEVAEEEAEEATPLTPEEVEKETKRETSRRNKDTATTLARAAKLRDILGKHFGDISKLELTELDLDLDEDAPADAPVYDDVELHLRTADGTHVIISVNDAVKLNGVWKFSGRLDDSLTIQLPDED